MLEGKHLLGIVDLYYWWLTFGVCVVYSLGLVESSRANGINTEMLLEVSNYMKDVRISMLSDDNFSKVSDTFC